LRARGLTWWTEATGVGASGGPTSADPEACNVATVAAVARELTYTVAAACTDGHDIFLLGGGCTWARAGRS